MRIKILGSGGYLRIPRALCTCEVCQEARLKGYPYKRLGQSLYLEDVETLFDTPEDINEILNNSEVKSVKRIIYSHWHPDHVLGARIVEVLKDGKSKENPLEVYIAKQENSILGMLQYFESLNYCKLNNFEDFPEVITDGKVIIKKLLMNNDFSSMFLFIENDNKVLYCPCHSKDIRISDEIYDVDLLIMSLGTYGFEEEGSSSFINDNLRIIREIKPKKVIFTHIEERYGLNIDGYRELEKEYKDLNIYFGFDNMEIDI